MSTYESLARRIYELRVRAEETHRAQGPFPQERAIHALNYRIEALLLATLARDPSVWDTGEYRELGDCPACKGEKTDPDTGGLCRVCYGDGNRTAPIRSFDPVDRAPLSSVPEPPDLAA